MKSRKESSYAYIFRMTLATFLSVFVIFIAFNIITMIGDLFVIKDSAFELKDNLQEVVTCVKTKDYEGAIVATDKMETTSQKMEKTFDTFAWKVTSHIPVVGDYVDSAFNIVEILNVTSDQILKPAVNVMSDYPLDNLKAGDGMFDVDIIRAYVDLAEQLDPAIDQIAVSLNGIYLPASMNGMVNEYMGKLTSLTQTYKDAEEFIPLLKAFIGDGSDKLYLLAAQNSSEIRASGGFPGAIGTIQISDGILSIGNFETVFNVMSKRSSKDTGITDEEANIFGSWMYYPRDACFSPDFERVAYIWSVAYREESKAEVDGIVSLTPTIIQQLLQYIGTITLSDGTELDGDNATRVLEHDLYYKYMTNDDFFASNDMTDALFEETAKTTMSLLVKDFSLERVAAYMDIFTSGAKDRTIMMWMANEEEQELVRAAGCSGGLNSDENNPEVGVYFSMSDSCKMGWYLDIDNEMSDPVLNEDGSLTYEMKVTLSNIVTKDEINKANWYILGEYNGGIIGYLYIIAPAGGTISDFETNRYGAMSFGTIKEHDIAYKHGIVVNPGSDFVVTYKVTTAPGVTTPLEISQTPTLQNYR